MREDEKALLQEMLDSIHTQFKEDIRKARPSLSEEQIEAYADGRIFTGAQAETLGFVDQVGGIQDVIDDLQKELGLEREPKVTWVREKRSRLSSLLEERWQGSAHDTQGLAQQILQAVGQLSPALKPELETGKAYLLPYYWFNTSTGPLSR
jgi:protease IV